MNPYIAIGDFHIFIWTLCLHLSYLITIAALLVSRPKGFALSRANLLWAAIIFAVSGLLGAKLLSILLTYISNPALAGQEVIRKAGMAYLGAPILGFISLWIFSAVKGCSFMEIADYAAPFLMLSRSIGRFGCLMEGCCYGIASNLPWRISIQRELGSLHPTQAYALIAAFAIFITMLMYYKRLRLYRGATFFSVITLYSFMRFFNEFLRADSFYVVGFLKLSNIAMLLLFIIGCVGMYFSLKKTPGAFILLKGLLRMFTITLIATSVFVLGCLTVVRIMKIGIYH